MTQGQNAPTYLDTNSLLGWARQQTGTCDAGEASIAAFVAPLLAGVPHPVAVSEVTLLEFYDNITHWHRKSDPGATTVWHSTMHSSIMEALAEKHVEVLAPESKLFEKAMRYVQLIAVPERRKFRAMDAAHLVHAVGWSRRLRTKIDFVSADTDFEKLIKRIPPFQNFVTQVSPQTGLDLTPR